MTLRLGMSMSIAVLILVVRVIPSLPSVAIVREAFEAKQFAEQRPPAHHVCDINGGARFPDVPDLVGSGQGRSEVEIFVEDGGDNGEKAQAHNTQEYTLSGAFKLGSDEEWDWDGEHDCIRRDIEDGLGDRVMLVRGALHIRDGHGPILGERSTVHCVIADHDDHEPQCHVYREYFNVDVGAQVLGDSSV